MHPVRPAVALLVPLLAAAPLSAQSATEVFERMLAEHDRRAESIDNYTVVQEAMGQPVTIYFEKEMSRGHAVFRVRDTRVAGARAGGAPDADSYGDLWDHLPELMERASYAGRETVDGHAVHVVTIDDLASTAFAKRLARGTGDFQPRRGTFFVDTERWVPRRMVFEGRLTVNGKPADVTMHMDMQDYRDVDGLLQPFRTLVRIEGLGGAVDPEMRKQYEEMKTRLAEMPEAQRAMAERMMKGQLEQMEKMMGDDGAMNVEIVVREVRVNAGPLGG